MSSSLITVLRPHPDVPTAVDEAAQHGLLQVLAAIPDPRDPRGVRYQLTSLLAVAVCAVLAGAVTFAAIADWAADLDPRPATGWGSPDRSPQAPRCGGS